MATCIDTNVPIRHSEERGICFSPPTSRFLAAFALAALLPLAGCARAPGSAVTGVRLVVTLRFNGPINNNYQYLFLVRNGNDQIGQNGPIPVILPPYLNGFATGENAATAGFTDFVEYSRVQRQNTGSGYGVYHLPGGITGNPNLDIFEARGEPAATQSPAGSNTLRFELTLKQIEPNGSEPGQDGRYLQINVVATTTTPHDPASVDPAKVVDAFGDTRLGSGSFNKYLTIDTAQTGRTYQSSSTPGDAAYEPERDSYPDDRDPAVDLIAWSVQITG